MRDRPVTPPSHEDLVRELAVIREAGITQLRTLDLPALTQALRASGTAGPDQIVSGPDIEEALRRAIADLDGTRLGDCAGLLFGLEPGTRGDPPPQLRREAAERWGVAWQTFRKTPQTTIFSEMADAILRESVRYQRRLALLALERRLPTSTRLAVAWLERFETYFRMWAPISGIGNDLTAYRSTLIDPDRPWDHEADHDDPDDEGYTQERQAHGHLAFALCHYADFLDTHAQFLTRYGGQWLLSDSEAEQAAADAVYRIQIHSPFNERDASWMRQAWRDAGTEIHPYLTHLASDQIGQGIKDDWFRWAETCRCTWDAGDRATGEPFPTHRHAPGIEATCHLHAMVSACGDYMNLINDDWKHVADWYRMPLTAEPVVDAFALLYGFGASD
jgi:hypothetical protein